MTEEKKRRAEKSNQDSSFVNKYLADHGYRITKNPQSLPKIQKSKFEENINWKHPSVLRLLSESINISIDPIEIIREKSRNLVLGAFTNGWVGPPFDVIELAKMNGIQVGPNDMVSEARIVPLDGNFKIEYNPSQSPARINFSVAHEIAHTLFSDCSDTIRYRKNEREKESWELEFLCNIAAAEILLPYAEFTGTANEIEPSIDNIIKIARIYRASVESVFLRFSQVVEKPCNVVVCSFKSDGSLVVDYSKASLNSNVDIPKGYSIPRYSKVFECIKTRWTSYAIETWDLFNDTRYCVYGVGLSPIKGHATARVGILIVPEIYDSTPKIGVYTVNGDATEPRGEGTKIITQVINTSGALGFGFGRAMAKRYPKTKKSVAEWKLNKQDFRLGNSKTVELGEGCFAFQILAQKGIRPNKGVIPLKYNALRKGLIALRDFAQLSESSVHMPAIGAGQAGGDWNIIKGMIYDELVIAGIDVTVYLLPGNSMKSNQSTVLTLFKGDT